MVNPASKSENAMSEVQPVLMIGGSRGTGLLIARLLHRGRGAMLKVKREDRGYARITRSTI
jgi:hypothetical protein